jgi:peptidoglycan/LPS O-acetylase OafA/YrhL
MKTTTSISRIEFANSLRGIAVLTVLFGHYVIMFNALKGQYSAFPPMHYFPFPWAHTFIHSYPMSYLNFGQIAVALFFLVSGLVIPNSAVTLGNASNGRCAFVIGRLLRIWPTYIVGLLISVIALWLNSEANSAEFYQPWTRIVANMTLFRDWLGQAQIDGVVWTLETEAKFYIFVLFFWSAIGKGRLYPLAIIGIAALVASPLGAAYEETLGPELSKSNFLWAIPYLLYMSIGIAFNYHLRRVISTKSLLLIASVMCLTFICVAKNQGLYDAVPASYSLTLLVFGLLYFFARGWSGGPVIRFFAKISFPLYACHAALGYSGMAYMISLGANPYAALAVQIVISTGLSWAIHAVIEVPTHNAGKQLGKKLIATTGLITIWTRS